MPSERLSGAIERATALLGSGFNCAQSVAAAFAPAYGLDEATALRLACAFGGGVAGAGDTCGAVSGALAVIGLARGSCEPDRARRAEIYALAQEFQRRYRRQHGSTVCRELIGVDLGSPGGMERAAAAGLFRERCPVFIAGASRILVDLLGGPGGRP